MYEPPVPLDSRFICRQAFISCLYDRKSNKGPWREKVWPMARIGLDFKGWLFMLFCKSAKKYDFNQSDYPNPAFGHSDTVQVSFECSVTKEANGHKTVSNCSTCSTEFNNEDGNGWQWLSIKYIKFSCGSERPCCATYWKASSPVAPAHPPSPPTEIRRMHHRARGPEAMTGQEVTHEAGARHPKTQTGGEE